MTPKAGSGSTIFQGIFMLLSLALLATSETANTENILAGVNQDGNDVFLKNLSNQGEDSNAQYFTLTTEKISKFVEFNETHDDSNLKEINDDDEKEPTTPKSIKDDGKNSLKDDTNVNYNGNSQTASPDEIVTISQKNSKLIEKPNLIPEDSVDKLENFKYNAEQVLEQPNGVVEGGDNNNKILENIQPVTEAINIETITTIIEPELSNENINGSLLPKGRNIPSSKLNNFNTGEKVIDTTKESSTSAPTKEIIPDLYYESSTSNPTTFNHSTTNQPKDTDNIINQYDQNVTEPSNHQNPAQQFKPLPIKRSENKINNRLNSTSLGSTPTYNEISKNFDGKETKIIGESNRTDENSEGLDGVPSVETSTGLGNGSFYEEHEPENSKTIFSQLDATEGTTVLPSIVNITTTRKTTESLTILAEVLTTNSPKVFETTTSISSSPDESTNLDTSETTTPEIKTTSEIKPTSEIETTTSKIETTTSKIETTTPEIKIEYYGLSNFPTTDILPNSSTNTTSESITSPIIQDTTTENNPVTTAEIPITDNFSTIDDAIPETTLQTTPLPEEPTTITEFTSQENSEILKIVSGSSGEEGRGIYSTQEMNFTTTPTTLIIPYVENKTSNLNTASVPKISSTTLPSISAETSPEIKTSYFPNTTVSVSTEITTTTVQNDVYPRSGQNVDVVVQIVVEAHWTEVCKNLPELQKALADLLSTSLNKSVEANQIIFQTDGCKDNIPDPVVTLYFYVINKNSQFDPKMTEILPALYSSSSIKTNLTITSVQLIQNTDSGNAIAVVVVCCVAFICLVLLAGLLFIMRKRQTRFNYGERCRPVSLDAYSLDSVSAYNSVRRKGAMRSSKRSYGNPTFEDSTAIPSHPLNFSVLSKFCNEENKIYEEYSNIPQVTAKIDELPPGAEIKNRYANVIPLPETRVPLANISNDPLTEYINASYVRGPKNATKYYIACQAPIESTVADFWRMIWEQQTKVIIMLTELVENDVEKCAEYIPPSEVTDCRRLYGDFQVTLKKRETKEKYAISTLLLKNLEDKTYREITHIWYLWPTSGIQTDAVGMIAVLLEARALQRGGPGPIVVHCSPGTGRTGTLIALDLGIRQYEITRTVDVPRVVYTIRRDRAGAVQTKEQYAFIYKALNLYATKLAGGGLEST